MKKTLGTLVVLVLLGGLGSWGYVHFLGGQIPFLSASHTPHQDAKAKAVKKDPSDQEELPPSVTATVKVTPVRWGALTVGRILYGHVVPGKGALVTVSAPYESRVLRILVQKGQEVKAGERLIELGPSANSRLAIDQARNKSEMAQQQLKRVKQRLAMRLATNQELIQAMQAANDAKLALESLSQRGMSKPMSLTASTAAVIHSINVQEGAVVSIGTALLDMASLSKLAVQLGAEPDIVPRLREGQSLMVSALGNAAPPAAACAINGIGSTVDPTTHLVDIFLRLPNRSRLMLGEPVQGVLEIHSKPGLIVPRSAALPEANHYTLFVVKDHHARKIHVQLGMQNDQEVEVTGEGLHAGDAVVSIGNYELENGMAVKTVAAS